MIIARDGIDTLEQIRTQQPAVVLLDIEMPHKSGLEVLKELKASGNTVGVIMVTGVEEEAVGREALAMGAFDYILKPFDLAYLEKVLWWKLQMLE